MSIRINSLKTVDVNNNTPTTSNAIINKIKANENINIILKKYKEHILRVMEKDIPTINKEKRDNVANYMIEFIEKAIQKEYINENNLEICMERIISATNHFYNINNPVLYGECYKSNIGFNFNDSFFINNMKHIIFHEMAHVISNLYNQNPYYFGESNKNKIRPEIINHNMILFLDEIMAESTACDLEERYSNLSAVDTVLNLYSDWIIPWNRNYQTLGCEFLKTLLPNSNNNSQTDRQLFKNFTLEAINHNSTVSDKIIKAYQGKNPNTWKEDLHEISTILGNIFDTQQLNKDKINKAKRIMTKYKPKRGHINIHGIEQQESKRGHINIHKIEQQESKRGHINIHGIEQQESKRGHINIHGIEQQKSKRGHINIHGIEQQESKRGHINIHKIEQQESKRGHINIHGIEQQESKRGHINIHGIEQQEISIQNQKHKQHK